MRSSEFGTQPQRPRRLSQRRRRVTMMSHRYRLYPTPDQEPVLERHSADARYVWNLALEQVNFGREQRDGKWRDKEGLGPRPGPAARQRQLAEARQGTWLAEGSSSVQQ